MKQLNIFCEGATEQGFCVQVLQPHLFPQHDGIIHTLAVGEKDHHHLYGVGRRVPYERIRKFICNMIKSREGENVYFTTLLDLYALPNDFPGKDTNTRNPADPTPYVTALEKDFQRTIGYYRFIPYLQLHEYETMLFVDPTAFRIAFESCEAEIARLATIAASVPTVEHIDDGKDTAPSKRIIEILPTYRGKKTTAGPDIVELIGLDAIRKKCPHVDQWLTKLESIPWEDE